MTGLGALFAPRGIGVIGASADPSKLGAAMARSLAPFPGPVLLVSGYATVRDVRDGLEVLHSSVGLPGHRVKRPQLAVSQGEVGFEAQDPLERLHRLRVAVVVHLVQGVYVMPPLGRYSMALDVLEAL